MPINHQGATDDYQVFCHMAKALPRYNLISCMTSKLSTSHWHKLVKIHVKIHPMSAAHEQSIRKTATAGVHRDFTILFMWHSKSCQNPENASVLLHWLFHFIVLINCETATIIINFFLSGCLYGDCIALLWDYYNKW